MNITKYCPYVHYYWLGGSGRRRPQFGALKSGKLRAVQTVLMPIRPLTERRLRVSQLMHSY